MQKSQATKIEAKMDMIINLFIALGFLLMFAFGWICRAYRDNPPNDDAAKTIPIRIGAEGLGTQTVNVKVIKPAPKHWEVKAMETLGNIFP